jgi:hypothetical protein
VGDKNDRRIGIGTTTVVTRMTTTTTITSRRVERIPRVTGLFLPNPRIHFVDGCT